MRKILCLVGLLTLVSCERIEFKNGQIPDQYLPLAQSLEGHYAGSFEGIPYQLNLEIQDHRAHMTLDPRGNKDCHFEIGDITSADASKDQNDQPQIDHAVFQLKHQTCFFLVGEEVELSFSREKDGLRVVMSILRSMDNRDECRIVGGTPENPPHQVCEPKVTTDYVIGDFTRH